MEISPKQPIRILSVEDHEICRVALSHLIERQANLQVIGNAGDAASALPLAESEQPDIILLDLDLGDEDGLDLLPKLLDVAKQAKVIILTGSYNNDVHAEAVRCGASGVVTKANAFDVLINAIEAVMAGEVWLDQKTTAKLLGELSRSRRPQQIDPDEAKIGTLSPREREVIKLVGEGLKNQQIANRLFISETTVRHHLTSIFDKLELSDRVELIIYAYNHDLATLPRKNPSA
ncbi:MAG: response regulator transcription factor [Blastocatellales bacterium]